MTIEKKLAPWRPLQVRQRVESKTYKKGTVGTVKERLDQRVDGLGRYGVVLDSDRNNTADFSRWELKAVRKNRRIQYA